MNEDNNLKSYKIDIKMEETCDCVPCGASRFPTNYPSELRNYINSNEFHQSITNINNKFPKTYYTNTAFITILFIIALALIVGSIVIIAVSFESLKKREFVPIIIAFVFVLLGSTICFFSCRCYCNEIEKIVQMRLTIEEESKKYEERHCQWLLEARKDDPICCVSRRHQVTKFHLIITIDLTNTNVPTIVRSDSDILSYLLADEQQRFAALPEHQV